MDPVLPVVPPPELTFILQHDNVPIHTEGLLKMRGHDHQVHIKRLQLLSNSAGTHIV